METFIQDYQDAASCARVTRSVTPRTEVSVKSAYRRFLDTGLGATTYKEFKRILYTDRDSLVQVVNTVVAEHLNVSKGRQLRICDIGGGNGDRVAAIMRFLNEHSYRKLALDFVEQSGPYVEEFRHGHCEPFCTSQIHHGLFEQTDLAVGEYDLVLVIHSIFAFQGHAAVDKVLSLRSPHGTILVVSNSPASFLGGLKALVDVDFQDHRFEVDDLRSSLQQRGIHVREYRVRTCWTVPVQNWEHDIGIVLEWISLGRFTTFSPNRKQEILEYARSRGRLEGELWHFTEEELILVIRDWARELGSDSRSHD